MIACARCRSPWHEGQTCSEYSSRLLRADFQSIEIAENGRSPVQVQECPKCHQALYKSEGCDHMTCICGYEFCYICRRKFLRESSVDSILLVRHRSSCRYRNSTMQGFSIHGMTQAELYKDRWMLEFVDTRAAITITFEFIEEGEDLESRRLLVHRDFH